MEGCIADDLHLLIGKKRAECLVLVIEPNAKVIWERKRRIEYGQNEVVRKIRGGLQ